MPVRFRAPAFVDVEWVLGLTGCWRYVTPTRCAWLALVVSRRGRVMAGEESLSSVPPIRGPVGTPSPERELPASLEPWVAALSVSRPADQHLYRLVVRAYSERNEPEWTIFSSFLVHASIVEPASQSEAYIFRPEGRGDPAVS